MKTPLPFAFLAAVSIATPALAGPGIKAGVLTQQPPASSTPSLPTIQRALPANNAGCSSAIAQERQARSEYESASANVRNYNVSSQQRFQQLANAHHSGPPPSGLFQMKQAEQRASDAYSSATRHRQFACQ